MDGQCVKTKWARPGGHPLHPMLVHFPVACWTVGVGADLAGHASGHAGWWSFGLVCLNIGLVTGIAAILAGFLEFALLPKQHPALDTATLHMMWALVAWSLFALSLFLRSGFAAEQLSLWATAASLGGLAAMLVAGWLGGRLVYRFGVGVATPAQR
jgi:uncharacterized membrane protein